MGVVDRQKNVGATGSCWDSEVTVVGQASEVAELRKVLCGCGLKGGRIVFEGHDSICVLRTLLRTRICCSVLKTYVKGYGQVVDIVDSDWENWKTRYDLRTSTPASTF